MLSGFRSRWTMLCWCAALSALADLPRATATASASGSLPRSPSRLASEVALEQLHHDVRRAVVGRAVVVDLDDPGVADRRRGLGLVEEALHELRVGRQLRAQHLHGRRAAEHRVLGAEHRAHAAAVRTARGSGSCRASCLRAQRRSVVDDCRASRPRRLGGHRPGQRMRQTSHQVQGARAARAAPRWLANDADGADGAEGEQQRWRRRRPRGRGCYAARGCRASSVTSSCASTSARRSTPRGAARPAGAPRSGIG